MIACFDVTEINDLTKRFVKTILNNVHCKIPIKKSDLVKHTLRANSKCFPQVFNNAKLALNETYGMDLVEVPEMSVKQYIVISQHYCASSEEYTKEQSKFSTLLYLVLSCIYMQGKPITGEHIFNFLKSVTYDGGNNDTFELIIKKQVTETFVKQLYLKKEKYESDLSSKKDFLYSWGYRAEQEVSKNGILELIAQLYGKPPRTFIKQFTELHIHETSQDELMDETE